MKHIIEFNLPDDQIDLVKHIDAVKQNANFRSFIGDFEQYLRTEWKHGPSTTNAFELIEKIRNTFIDMKESNDVLGWEELENFDL